MTRAEVLAKVLAQHRNISGKEALADCFCVPGLEMSHDAYQAHVADALDAALAAQEGERGGAEVAATVEAVIEQWDALRVQMDAAGLPVVAAELRACASDVRAALADPAGALAKHDAEVLRAAADDYFTGHYYDHFRKWLRDRADRTAGDQS